MGVRDDQRGVSKGESEGSLGWGTREYQERHITDQVIFGQTNCLKMIKESIVVLSRNCIEDAWMRMHEFLLRTI